MKLPVSFVLGPVCISIAAVLLAPAAAAETHTCTYDMEIPPDWSDVNMEWGAGGKIDFAVEEPGRPGRALHMTTKPVQNPEENPPVLNPCRDRFRGHEVANEGRCLQFSHKPGSKATIEFDFKVFSANDHAWFTVAYYDGYVTAEFFQANLGDPFYAIPEPIVAWKAGDSREWRHYSVTTDVLEYPVMTLWMHAAQSRGPGYVDAAIDNLTVTVETADEFYDPDLAWGGEDMDKMTACRQSNTCRDISWCDVMYDEFGPAEPGSDDQIYYGSMVNFRLTTANYRDGGMLAMKHDWWHRRRELNAGGASVIGFASIHGADDAKSMGIRQTCSYQAWGIRPDQKARVVIQARAASSVPEYEGKVAARTLIGADPAGGVLGNAPGVVWSDEGVAHVRERWTIHRIEFEKPAGAENLTVFLKWRDGLPGDDCGDRAVDGNEGWFDWVLVEVEPIE
jgi:hypothetical protein